MQHHAADRRHSQASLISSHMTDQRITEQLAPSHADIAAEADPRALERGVPGAGASASAADVTTCRNCAARACSRAKMATSGSGVEAAHAGRDDKFWGFEIKDHFMFSCAARRLRMRGAQAAHEARFADFQGFELMNQIYYVPCPTLSS